MTTQRKTFFLTKKLFKIKTIRIGTERRGQKNFQNKKTEKRQKETKLAKKVVNFVFPS